MPQAIGKFELRRVLGRGAQSTVHLAFDPVLQREVALKLLPKTGTGASLRRLLDEARAAGRLRHPSVVPIFEAGEQEGQAYLVFEYVEGRSLQETLRSGGALEPLRAAALMIEVLDALICAHAAGIIHRDLKPSNILIGPDGRARVMDFGIATPAVAEDPSLSGTPAYMAPEYIAEKRVTPQYDVFAAGLLLFEMLTGQRAVPADDPFQAMHQIANLPLVFPADRLDPVLHEIVSKATAKDVELRYASAEKMREALQAYLQPAVGGGDGPKDARQSTLEFLLRRMKVKSDFPAMSAAISTIQRMASAERGDVQKLSAVILKDIALTHKILRLVNSSYYPRRHGGGISTISRAIVMMGFDAVTSIATSLVLFEHLKDKKHADALKDEFLSANMSAIISAELCGRLRIADSETVYVCAIFHNLGRLLAQYYLREEADAIARIVAQERCSEDLAATRVLGISYQDLGIGIAQNWGFPSSIVQSMKRLPPGKVFKPRSADDQLRMISAFSWELTALHEDADAGARAAGMQQLLQRYGDSLPLGERELNEVFDQSAKHLADLASTLRINLGQTRIGRRIERTGPAPAATPPPSGVAPGVPVLPVETAEVALADGDGEVKKEAMTILAAGIQDISQALVEDMPLADVLRIIAETIYRALDVKRVLMCTRDGRTGRMSARFGYGDGVDEVVRGFQFALGGSDFFNIVLGKDADILIRDARVEKIRRLMPDWYLRLLDAPSFLILPVNIKGVTVAMIYADQDTVDGISVADKELALLRTLRNQTVMAVKQAR